MTDEEAVFIGQTVADVIMNIKDWKNEYHISSS